MSRHIRTVVKPVITAGFFLFNTVCALAQPGENYFQQEVNYKISVKLDDVHHTLTGFEEIEYINNSPHTLRHLYFHLWPNAYKNNETALAKQFIADGKVDFHYASAADRGYIDSLFFRVNGDSVGWKLEKENIDICKIYLKEVLKPGDTIHITTPFFLKIPHARFSRLGHLEQSYFITQWYPKPAVYDKNGWNQMPYLNQGEFYSEYGSFDVSITLPKNYVVGATGDLTDNPEEEKFMEDLYKKTLASFKDHTNKVGNIIGGDEYPASDTEWKTLRFRQKNVHDFGWFADKRWQALRGEYVLPESGRVVTTWALFTRGNSAYWKKSIEYINDAVKYYSQWNGEYPYNQVTAVDGTISAGGGMEYPNVTVIGNVSGDLQLETVIMHEVGHNWFYGILGSNERIHGWMDEGINSFNEMRYMRTKYPGLKLKDVAAFLPEYFLRGLGLHKFDGDQLYYSGYLLSARQGTDQPIETKSEDFLPVNYGTIMYMKTATSFDFLRAYLGEKVFDKCMHAYFDAWKFKHPTPIDIRIIFENTSKKDLSWFFEGMINTNGVIDYKIQKIKKPNTKSTSTYGWMTYEEGLLIRNKGDLAVPFVVQGIKADTIQQQRWYFGHSGKQILSFPNGNYDRIVIDYKTEMPEINRRNNTLKYKHNGKRLFKRWEKLRLKFAAELEDPNRTTIFWAPAIGFNMYDRVMPGVALYNSILPQRPVEWTLVPLFSSGTLNVAGHADVTLHFNTRKSNWLRSLHWNTLTDRYSFNAVNGSLFSFTSRYLKVQSGMRLDLRPKKTRSFTHQHIYLTGTYIQEDTYYECEGDCDNLNLFNPADGNRVTAELKYFIANGHPLHPWQVAVAFRNASQFNLLWSEARYAVRFSKKPPLLNFRWFAGYFITNTSNLARYNFRMDGQHGYNDYNYETIFVGRNETSGLWSHQFVNTYGGIKAPTANGQSYKWLTALNVDIRTPVPTLHVFADAGISDPGNGTTFVGDAGVNVDFGALKVYFPLWVSSKIADEYKANGYDFGYRVRFTLDIADLSPLKFLKNALDQF